MSTPHIEAKKGEIAKTVLMPGDPLRAKFIAENFLEDVVCFNEVRGMLGFTGTYKGTKVSVMGHGMGQPSIGIYSYELYSYYDVESIIRVGSCGAYSEKLDLFDLLVVDEAYSESTYAKFQANLDDKILKPSSVLTKSLEATANKLRIKIQKGRVESSDVFYTANPEHYKISRDKYGCLAVEMEAFALFSNAQYLNKQAACLLTVSDHFLSGEVTTSKQRETGFTNMMNLALETAIS